MKKRFFAGLMVVMLMLSAFIGCTNSEKEVSGTVDETNAEKEAQADNKETKIETKKLSIIASQDWIQEAEIELGKKFEEETGIKVDYQIYPSDQYFNVLLTKLNAGEELDIFMSQSGAFDIVTQLDITNNGVPLTDEAWVKDFDSLTMEQLSVDGVLYGQTIADTYSTWTVAYNKKIFSDLGLEIPSNYDEFMNVCEAISSSGVVPIYECVADGWHHTLWWHEIGPIYEKSEPGIYDDLNKNNALLSSFESPKTALDQIKEMVDRGYWGEDYMSNQYANMPASIANGEYAMAIAQQNFGEQVDALEKDVKGEDIGYFVIPLLDNQTICINPAGPSRFIYSNSKNIEASKLYFEFVARNENLQYILDNSERYSNLPFEGLDDKYTDNVKEFYDRYSDRGTVLQTAVKYINPQWMDTGSDITSHILGISTAEDVLDNIDGRRSDQAKAAKDSSWDE